MSDLVYYEWFMDKPKKFKNKTITLCPECSGIADMTQTNSTVVILQFCSIHRNLKYREEAGTYFECS